MSQPATPTPPDRVLSRRYRKQVGRQQRMTDEAKVQPQSPRPREADAQAQHIADYHDKLNKRLLGDFENRTPEQEDQKMTMMHQDNSVELSDEIKLNAMAKKAKELEGYLNQMQDAVTIGMYRLRDLQKQVAAATAALGADD
ncbi:hypothetical protein F4802DRAFT_565609 [Xylaria palmicola]|nr:hypothetical protein F4802DRAFT_565609 [Xylaria palmicola]